MAVKMYFPLKNEQDNKYAPAHTTDPFRKEELLGKSVRNLAGGAASLAHMVARIPAYLGEYGEYAAQQEKGTHAKNISTILKSIPGVEKTGDLLRSYGKGVDKISRMIDSVFPKGFLHPQTPREEVVQPFLPLLASALGTSGASILANPEMAWPIIKQLGVQAAALGTGRAAATGAEILGGGPLAQLLASIGAGGLVSGLAKSNIIKDYTPKEKALYDKSRSVNTPRNLKNENIKPPKEFVFTPNQYDKTGFKPKDLPIKGGISKPQNFSTVQDSEQQLLRSKAEKSNLQKYNKRNEAYKEKQKIQDIKKHTELENLRKLEVHDKNEKLRLAHENKKLDIARENKSKLDEAIIKAGYDPKTDKFENFGRAKQKDLRNTVQDVLNKSHQEGGSKLARDNSELILNKFRTDKENVSNSIEKIGKQKYSNFQLMEDLNSKGIDSDRNKRLNNLFPDGRMVNKNGTVNKKNLEKLYRDDISVNETYDLKQNIAKLRYSNAEGSRLPEIKRLEGATQSAASATGQEYPIQHDSLRKADKIHQLLLKVDKAGWLERIQNSPNKMTAAMKAIPTAPNWEAMWHFITEMPAEGLERYLKYAKAAAKKDYPALIKASNDLKPYLEKKGKVKMYFKID